MGELTAFGDALVDGMLAAEEAFVPKPEEDHERKRMLAYLFKLFGEDDAVLAQMYFDQTSEIPLWALRLGLKALVRKYRWPKLPRIADIWLTSKEIAGMHRQQYRAGRYIEPPPVWPPEGQRHAIQAGAFEPIRTLHGMSLPRIEERLRLETGEQGEVGVTQAQAEVFD